MLFFFSPSCLIMLYTDRRAPHHTQIYKTTHTHTCNVKRKKEVRKRGRTWNGEIEIIHKMWSSYKICKYSSGTVYNNSQTTTERAPKIRYIGSILILMSTWCSCHVFQFNKYLCMRSESLIIFLFMNVCVFLALPNVCILHLKRQKSLSSFHSFCIYERWFGTVLVLNLYFLPVQKCIVLFIHFDLVYQKTINWKNKK